MSKFSKRGRAASAKFPKIGTTVAGTVVSISDEPVPNFDSAGRIDGPRFNLDGTMLTQVDIVIESEDGQRAVLHTGGNMFNAIDEALDAAKLIDLVTGHKLSVTYVGNDEDSGKEYAPKLYEATVQHA